MLSKHSTYFSKPFLLTLASIRTMRSYVSIAQPSGSPDCYSAEEVRADRWKEMNTVRAMELFICITHSIIPNRSVASFPFPSGWGRLQPPKHHLSNYRDGNMGYYLSFVNCFFVLDYKPIEITDSPVSDLKPIDTIVQQARQGTVEASLNLEIPFPGSVRWNFTLTSVFEGLTERELKGKSRPVLRHEVERLR